MDFALTQEQIAFRDLARRFAEQEIAPVAAHYEQSDEFIWPVARKAYQAGLLNIHIPEEYGGGGLSALDGVIIREELAVACSGITSALMITNLPTRLPKAGRYRDCVRACLDNLLQYGTDRYGDRKTPMFM